MSVRGAGVESALSASSDEAEWNNLAGALAPYEDEASSDPKSNTEPDSPSQTAVEPDSVLVSVRSSPD